MTMKASPKNRKPNKAERPDGSDAAHNGHGLPEHRTGNHGQNRENIKQEGGF
jgi:hypothetical protein